MTLLEHGDPNNAIRYDLMYQLATANRIAGQDRAAEKLLLQIVERFSSYTPARQQLAELYLQRNNVAEAEKHITILASNPPVSHDVLRLEIALAQRQNRPQDAKQFYAQLPEEQFDQKLNKAQTAAGLRMYDEAIRLLTLMQKEKPHETGITVALVESYARSNQPDKGKQILADALKQDPADPRLLMLQKELEGHLNAAQDQQLEYAIKSVGGDPFYREIEAGRVALSKENFAEAISHANAADLLRPNDPATWDFYFQLYRRQRNWPMAAKAVDNLTRLNGDQADGRMYRWSLAMARGLYSEAINVARELTVVREAFGQSWMLLAQAYQANGQYHEAVEQYTAALERQTTNIDAYNGLADCYYALSQPERARESLAMGRRLFPENIGLRERLLADQLQVDPLGVVPIREQILADDPNESENYVALASAQIHAAQRLFAVDPIQAKSYIDAARDVLSKGVGKFPSNLRLNGALAEALQSGGRQEDGVKVLQDLMTLAQWKDKPDPYLLLSDYYTRAKKLDLSEKALRDGWAKTNNKNIDIELQLTGLLEQQQKYDEALAVLKTNSNNPRVIRQALQVHIAANHTEEARKGLDEAIKNSPDDADMVALLDLLAVVNIDSAHYPEARDATRRALLIDPRNDVAMYYQALTEMRDPLVGDLSIAVHNLGVIVTRSPSNVQYKLEYANALLRTKDNEGATVQLEDAVRLEPFNKAARLKLLDLYTLNKKWSQFEDKVNYAELNPAISGPIWARMHAYAFSAQGRYPEAIAKIREAISLDENNETYARDYLVILLQSKDTDGVIRETDRLLDAGHHQWWVYHLRGLARLRVGRSLKRWSKWTRRWRRRMRRKTPTLISRCWIQSLKFRWMRPSAALFLALLEAIAGGFRVFPFACATTIGPAHWRI